MIGASRFVPESNCLLGYTCLVVTHAKIQRQKTIPRDSV
jgi:hypothetical protein